MNVFTPKGIVADKTYVMVNGATFISDVSYYFETYKDANGKKRKKMHSYFELDFGEYSKIRFERLRGNLKPHFDEMDAHTLVVYVDEQLQKTRQTIVNMFK